jgi:hypothetical protein
MIEVLLDVAPAGGRGARMVVDDIQVEIVERSTGRAVRREETDRVPRWTGPPGTATSPSPAPMTA